MLLAGYAPVKSKAQPQTTTPVRARNMSAQTQFETTVRVRTLSRYPEIPGCPLRTATLLKC